MLAETKKDEVIMKADMDLLMCVQHSTRWEWSVITS